MQRPLAVQFNVKHDGLADKTHHAPEHATPYAYADHSHHTPQKPQVCSEPTYSACVVTYKETNVHLLFSTEVLSHIFVSLLHVLTIHTKISSAALLLSVT